MSRARLKERLGRYLNKSNDGCIYTQAWVVDFMLDLCGYKEEKDLSKERLLEPSCGEGSFVLSAIDRLCASAQKYHRTCFELKNSIRAYDTDFNALSIVKRKSKDLLLNHGFDDEQSNYLIKAWFIHGDFIESPGSEANLIIGNPPYIRATDISEEQRKKYQKKLTTFTLGTDMYIAFMEKGIDSLRNDGKLCFICSDRWQKNKFGKKFRNFLNDEGYHISFNCQMHNVQAFEKSVTAYPSVTIIERNTGYERKTVCNDNFGPNDANELIESLAEPYKKTDTFEMTTFDNDDDFERFPLIEDTDVSIGIGIATGRDKVFVTTDSSIVEPDRLLPLAHARDIRNNQLPLAPVRWLINPWENGKPVNLSDYPKLEKYFSDHRAELSKRHIAQNHPDNWYRTIDKVRSGLLKKDKLLIRDLSKRTEPILDRGILYPHHNLYWITSDVWDLEVLGGILISDVVYTMMINNSVEMRGGVIRNQAQYLRKIRLPEYDSISAPDRAELKQAFTGKDRKLANQICERLYK
mgnify:CR=1 FL=1